MFGTVSECGPEGPEKVKRAKDPREVAEHDRSTGDDGNGELKSTVISAALSVCI